MPKHPTSRRIVGNVSAEVLTGRAPRTSPTIERRPAQTGSPIIEIIAGSSAGQCHRKCPIRERSVRAQPLLYGCWSMADARLTVVVLRSYHRTMSSVVKRSVSLPSEVFAALEREALAQGQTVSAALADAADQWLATRRGLRAVRAWERENGALTADELAAADAELDRAGVARR